VLRHVCVVTIGRFMLLDLKVQHGTAIVLEGSKDKVRIIVSNRAVWRRVKEMRSNLCFTWGDATNFGKLI